MAKKMWGARFAKRIDPLVEGFTRSIQYDNKLAEYDLLGSMLHVEIIRKAGFLNAAEASRLYKGLTSIYRSVKAGTFSPGLKCEDIHTDIQNKLERIVGPVALKLHTARSRNDQVVFATKLYSKIALSMLQCDIDGMLSSLHKLAAVNKGLIMPGFTHMQHAQPVYLKDYLGAYASMFVRDKARLGRIFEDIRLTMGAGALAGTPVSYVNYHVGPSAAVKGMKDFEVGPTENSLDVVSDRDFILDILYALSVVGSHLSRLAEDLIIWSTKEFDFVDIDESFCTGSSLMPQKKNADTLELVRGYAGRLSGNLIGMLMVMKGLPMSYNRDMQLDKEPLFNSFETVSLELKIMAGLMGTLRFNVKKINEYLNDESLYATDLIYYLVKKGEPFKGAHAIVGKLVRASIDSGVEIKKMSQARLDKFSRKLKKGEIIRYFDPKVSVESKRSIRR